MAEDAPGRRARRQGPQDRPHVAGDAAGIADRRARLRAAPGRHVLRARRDSVRSLHRAARRGRARVRSVPAFARPGRDARRRSRGGRRVRADAVDLRWVGAILYKNGVVEETGLAAGVLDHPGNGVVWLANKIAAYDEQLNGGDVVLGGSFTRPTTAARSDVFRVD